MTGVRKNAGYRFNVFSKGSEAKRTKELDPALSLLLRRLFG